MDRTEVTYRSEIVKTKSYIQSLRKELKRNPTLSGMTHKQVQEIIERHKTTIKHLEKGLTIYKQNLAIQNGKH